MYSMCGFVWKFGMFSSSHYMYHPSVRRVKHRHKEDVHKDDQILDDWWNLTIRNLRVCFFFEINILSARQWGMNFVDNIFKFIFLRENCCIFMQNVAEISS